MGLAWLWLMYSLKIFHTAWFQMFLADLLSICLREMHVRAILTAEERFDDLMIDEIKLSAKEKSLY